MKKRILLVVFLVLSFSSQLYAADFSGLAKPLIDVGVLELERGNFDTAVREFSRALLIEPNNKEAVHYLRQLGYGRGIYGPNNNHAEQMMELKQNAEMFQNEVKTMEQEKKLLDQEKGMIVENFSKLQSQKDQLQQAYHTKDFELAVIKEKQKLSMADSDKIQESTNKETVQVALKEEPLDSVSLYTEKSPDPEEEAYINEAEKQLAVVEIKNQFKDQYGHQDKLIHVLEDYLHVREDALENAKDRLIATKIDLTGTELQLMDHVNEMNRLMETYGLLVKKIDDKAFLVTQENDYDKFLKSKLDEVHQNLLNQNTSIEKKQQQLTSLRKNLKEAEGKIQQLMQEKNKILSDMGKDIRDLKK